MSLLSHLQTLCYSILPLHKLYAPKYLRVWWLNTHMCFKEIKRKKVCFFTHIFITSMFFLLPQGEFPFFSLYQQNLLYLYLLLVCRNASNFFLYENVFTSSSFFKDIFAGLRILDLQFSFFPLFLSPLKTFSYNSSSVLCLW